MTPLQLRPSSLDDMIFEGRNKAYGAFDLRQNYPAHVRRALAIALTLFALMAIAPTVARLLWPAPVAPKIPSDTVVELGPDPFMKPIVEPAKPEVAQPSVAQRTPTIAVPTHVVPNEKAKPQTQPVEEPIDAIPSTETSTGDPGAAVSPDGTLGDPNATTGAGGTATTPTAAPAKPEVFVYVEKMPEFMGGQEAMMKYLRRNMHYPALALRSQVEGKVFVAFTVSASGDITDVEIIKGLGYGTDEEAMRVVRQMPRWQAGVQNGQPVAVRYTLPITFSVR
jgi:protein TonB